MDRYYRQNRFGFAVKFPIGKRRLRHLRSAFVMEPSNGDRHINSVHTLPHNEFIAKLKSLTNIRVVRDPTTAEGWRVGLDPFPGWKKVPDW